MSEPQVFVETCRALPLVQLVIAFPRGATLDPCDREGLTRFMARLMRRTAGGLDSQTVEERLDAMGGSLAVEVTHSRIAVSGTVIRRSLEPFAALLADALAAPAFTEDELGRLRREVEGELIEERDSDRALARRWFSSALFEGHPYGRPIGGTLRSVAAFERPAVLEQYRRTIHSGSMLCGFAGDLSEQEAHGIASALAARLPPPPVSGGAQGRGDLPEPTALSGRRLLLVDKPQRTQTQILIGGLGTHPRDDDHFPLLVANTAFGGTFTARLSNEVRSKRGWSYGAYSSLPYGLRRCSFSMWTFPKASDAGPCVALELELLRAWREEGLTQEELDRAKKYLVGSHAFSVDTAGKRVGLQLESALYDLPAGYFGRHTEQVDAVTLDAANAAVRRRISDEDLLVTVVGTEANIGRDVAAAIPKLASTRVVPFDAP